MPYLFKRIWRAWPAHIWLSNYNRKSFSADLLAGLVVTMMLIPQGLAYAMLAGLPPVTGLYASILPLFAYALFGSSRTLAVGPVAIISLLSANAVAIAHQQTNIDVISLSMTLAMLSGLIMLIMGMLKLGFIANLLSRPVSIGFITGASIVIALGQLKHILGININGHNLLQLGQSIMVNISNLDNMTSLVGLATVGLLFWSRHYLKDFMRAFCSINLAYSISKMAPIMAACVATFVVSYWQLNTSGVKVIGEIAIGLPSLQWPNLASDVVLNLLPSAIIISLIGYVESISVAQTLANKRRQQINPNHELLGLGAANAAASISGGFAVTGGLSR